MLVGLDVGGTKILGVALGDNREVIAVQRRDTPSPDDDADALVATMAELVDCLVDEVRAGDTEHAVSLPRAVGLGLPGLVDRSGRLHFAPNLAGLHDADLGARLGRAAGVEAVHLDNDATCAMRAEHALGAAVGADHVLLVTLGTGIGGGLVLDGRVMRGAFGFAGEVGHMVVDVDGLACPCGRRGCWEQYASGGALGRMGREEAERGLGAAWVQRAGGSIARVRGEHVTAAAAAGDVSARALLSRFADWFAIGLANLVDILDVERCVLGGGLVEAGETLLAPIRSSFATRLLAASHRPEVAIVPALLGERAGAIGAALLAAEAMTGKALPPRPGL